MQIVKNHPCYLHIPKFPNGNHKIVKILRAISLFGGNTKKDIRKLALHEFYRYFYPCMKDVFYPDYAFTELVRNGYVEKISFKDCKSHRLVYVYDVTAHGRALLMTADQNDIEYITKQSEITKSQSSSERKAR